MSGITSVTVAICTWNRASVLGRTLEHMIGLRAPAGVEWELLVVDNGSSDRTVAVAEEFRGRLPVRVVSESRPGIAFARNRSIAEARGDLIVWTDDDVLVEADWLCCLVDGVREWDADFAFGRSLPCWDGEPPTWFEWNRHGGKFALVDYGPDPFVASTVATPFFTLNTAARVDAVRAVGGFRAELSERTGRLGPGEDVDLYARALAHGLKLVYLPGAVVRHIIPPDRKTKAYHRRLLRSAFAANYAALQEQFPSVPWLLGLPRFLFRTALGDMVALAASLAKRDDSEAFYRELQARRFFGMWRAALGSSRQVAERTGKSRIGRAG